jgi:hypothetical protein
MSRAQDRSSGLQSGQAAQRGTGDVSGTTGSTAESTGNVTGATGSSLRDQPATRTESSTSYARGTSGSGSGRSGGRGLTSHTGLGGVLTLVAGLLTFFAGLAAIVRQTLYHTLPNYPYRLTIHAWGWILFALGILMFAAGAAHLLGIRFGRLAAIGLAVLGTIAGFMWLAYSPFWGFLIVALSVVAIWALFHDSDQDERAEARQNAMMGTGSAGSQYMGSTSAGTTSTGTTAAGATPAETGATTSRSRSMRV